MNAPKDNEKGGSDKLAWALLVFCGGTSLTISLIHALGKLAQDAPFDHFVLAVLIGIAPALASALLAHMVSDPFTALWLKGIVFLVFLGAMVVSVNAQADSCAKFLGEDMKYLLPIVLDLATVAALLYLAGIGRKDPTEMITVKAEIRASLEAEIGAQIRAEAEAQIRPQIEAEIEAQTRTQIEAAETAARAAAEAEVPTQIEAAVEEARARIEAETEARIRLEMTKAKTAGKPDSKAKKGRASAPTPAITNGLSSKDNAVIIFEQDPSVSGADLGKALGLTAERGRQLLREIKEERAKADAEAARPAHLRAIG